MTGRVGIHVLDGAAWTTWCELAVTGAFSTIAREWVAMKRRPGHDGASQARSGGAIDWIEPVGQCHDVAA